MLASTAKGHTSSAWRSSQPSTLEHALKPVPSSATNAAPSAAYKNPLKRTASQLNGANQPLSKATLSRSSSSMLGKLHEDVYFDENDFEDDDNIDLNDAISNSSPTIQYPTLPMPPPKSAPSPNPASSQPLPWSSSPLHHRQASARQNETATVESDSSSTLVGDSTTVMGDSSISTVTYPSLPAEPKQSKRRTIPWLGEDPKSDIQNAKQRNRNEATAERQKKSPPAHVQDIIDKSKKRKHGKLVKNEDITSASFTPLPKDKTGSPFPWNTTASALKEEQRRLRQGHKTRVKNDPEGKSSTNAATTTRKPTHVPKVFLSDEQRKVMDLVISERKSVFFTGSAGTGKSVLLREIIKELRQKYQREPDRVAVTASTGLAACNVGGVTLHSFAGIGLGKEAVPELVRKIKRNPKAKNRWMRTKILIVDEISMVDGDLFDKLESIARSIRNNGRPFGGIQLVITGDFFQLPPVPDYGKIAKFSFDAATWTTSIEHTIGLTQVFRQKDPTFANMLNEMRIGRLTSKSIDAFRSLNRPLGLQDDFEATELFPTRQEVDNANNNRMKNLDGRAYDFKAADGGSITDIGQRDKLLANCMAPPMISLKKGAQVMLIKNIDETLVNGSVGKVVAFMDERTFDIYHEDDQEFQAVDECLIKEEEMTESRLKLRQLINKDMVGDTSHKWPLVRFKSADGNSRDLLCQPESWKIELPNGEVQASRSQIPLILAWALSIHKAQGQTLERVKVDLGKIFEKGQAYVALSRATTQEGLQIIRFDPKKVMAHDKVRGFYNSLYNVDTATSRSGGSQLGQQSAIPALIGGDPWEEDDDGLRAMYAR